MHLNWRDIGVRALKTAVQSAAAVLSVDAAASIDLTLLQTAGVAALGGAWSVVQNAMLSWRGSAGVRR